jgi:hypothetical protein
MEWNMQSEEAHRTLQGTRDNLFHLL